MPEEIQAVAPERSPMDVDGASLLWSFDPIGAFDSLADLDPARAMDLFAEAGVLPVLPARVRYPVDLKVLAKMLETEKRMVMAMVGLGFEIEYISKHLNENMYSSGWTQWKCVAALSVAPTFKPEVYCKWSVDSVAEAHVREGKTVLEAVNKMVSLQHPGLLSSHCAQAMIGLDRNPEQRQQIVLALLKHAGVKTVLENLEDGILKEAAKCIFEFGKVKRSDLVAALREPLRKAELSEEDAKAFCREIGMLRLPVFYLEEKEWDLYAGYDSVNGLGGRRNNIHFYPYARTEEPYSLCGGSKTSKRSNDGLFCMDGRNGLGYALRSMVESALAGKPIAITRQGSNERTHSACPKCLKKAALRLGLR